MASFGGQSLPRLRSVSMNCWLCGTDAVRTTPYRVADKLSDIVNPSPSQTSVFLDERMGRTTSFRGHTRRPARGIADVVPI